jgi:4-aminobutyrate aminotransferase-like enzyme
MDGPLKAEILARREAFLGPSLSISYQKPLQIVRGWKQFLYDENGRAFLDGVNNVCHVGHSHPRVVKALARQASVLNTNTRYLHPTIVRYAERLLATLPDPLEVCFFVCSGSEANELALRLARTSTGAEDMIVVDGAYHGNTAALIDISPYKHNSPGGSGAPPHVHTALMPDPYRGVYKGYGRASGEKYARHVQEAAAAVKAQGRGVAAFICESLLSCGGQIVLPDGYLQEAFRHVRTAGGVCIVDEVQVGFGRVGNHFWGFESQGAVPDIVTMGKPMGNGHPLAAVVTTRAIADAFANGMEYFNTFGGNPVSCAVGTAVLDVIEEEGLQENAQRTGEQLKEGLAGLMEHHTLIGDVRGMGLFVGVELVRDRQTLEPAAAEATTVVERMKEEGILLSIDGPLHNVLKLKPPMVFNEEDADRLVRTLDQVLGEDAAQAGAL